MVTGGAIPLANSGVSERGAEAAGSRTIFYRVMGSRKRWGTGMHRPHIVYRQRVGEEAHQFYSNDNRWTLNPSDAKRMSGNDAIMLVKDLLATLTYTYSVAPAEL